MVVNLNEMRHDSSAGLAPGCHGVLVAGCKVVIRLVPVVFMRWSYRFVPLTRRGGGFGHCLPVVCARACVCACLCLSTCLSISRSLLLLLLSPSYSMSLPFLLPVCWCNLKVLKLFKTTMKEKSASNQTGVNSKTCPSVLP